MICRIMIYIKFNILNIIIYITFNTFNKINYFTFICKIIFDIFTSLMRTD